MFSAMTSLYLLFTFIGLASAQQFRGQGTYYAPGLGSCGRNNVATDLIAALNAPQYTPASCGRRIRAFYNGRSVDVTIVDRCAGCAPGDIDLSPTAFMQLTGGSLDAGRINLSWQYI